MVEQRNMKTVLNIGDAKEIIKVRTLSRETCHRTYHDNLKTWKGGKLVVWRKGGRVNECGEVGYQWT